MTTEAISFREATLAKPDGRAKSKSRGGAQANGASGVLWFAGWLFTIGFCHLVWWKAVLALLVWPYFLGAALG
jgi:hypothetical protein